MSAARRRRVPLVAVFAVLLQAILFGWHHHEPGFAGRLTAPIIEKAAAPQQTADDEDRCDICSALHQPFAATVEFDAAPPHPAIGAVPVSDDPSLAALAARLAFRARAPPFA